MNLIFDVTDNLQEIMPEKQESVPTPIAVPSMHSADPTIPVDPPSSILAHSRQNMDKSNAQRTSMSISKKIVSIPHVTKKLAINGSKATKHPFAILKNPMHSSPADAIVDDNLLVKDVVSANGDWNWDFLRNMLEAVVILHILNLTAPISLAGSDCCCWSCGKNGAFSVKSAYTKLAQDAWGVKDAKWELLWHLPIPERIKFFLWLSLHGRILTNVYRFHRHLSVDPICSICAVSDESILHVLRDCRSTASL
ncbi:hypothetical protein V6N11_000333 [Hibiscus sabdariffa]